MFILLLFIAFKPASYLNGLKSTIKVQDISHATPKPAQNIYKYERRKKMLKTSFRSDIGKKQKMEKKKQNRRGRKRKKVEISSPR